MKRRATLSLLRTLVVYCVGVVAGIQVALYLFDLYDDGVASPLSGAIGVAFVAVGLVVALWPFLGGRAEE